MRARIVDDKELVAQSKHCQRGSPLSLDLCAKILLHLVTRDQFYQVLLFNVSHESQSH